jgi:hypothetical protein
MKKGLLTLLFITLSCKVMAQSWSQPEKGQMQKLDLAVMTSPVHLYGEIDHSEIGIKGPGIGPYGTPDGGMAGVLAMMLTHGVLLRAQQNAQIEQINAESLQFGAALTSRLNGISSVQLIQEALSGSFQAHPITVIGLESNSNSFSGYYINYRFSVTRDYHGLILNISFSKKSSEKAIADFVVYYNNQSPYIDNNEKYDIKNDMLSLVREAIGLFYNKDNLVKNMPSSSVTFRSLVGKRKMFERGYLISQTCERHLFINLSETWVAAPKLEHSNLDQCTPLASPSQVEPLRATPVPVTL